MQRPIDPGPKAEPEKLELEAERGRALLEESPRSCSCSTTKAA